MRRRWTGATGMAVFAMLACGSPWSPVADVTPTVPGNKAELRVGTYDNRAIAIAWGRSKFMHKAFADFERATKSAKEAGDTERQKQLMDHAKWRQKKLHFQGFGHANVRELLADIKGELPQIARQAKIDVIAWECDYVGKGVKKVDITDLLVARFEPSKKTLEIIGQLGDIKPIPLERLDRTPKDH